jgi:WD40 repeat protein
MSAMSCPEPARLRAHLEGTLAGDDEQEVTTHLDSCAACQQALERLAAGGEELLAVARDVGREPPPGAFPGLRESGPDGEADGPPVPPAAVTLAFLAPADQPGQLGRLGHYAVTDVIGHGGMGVVLKAFDERLRRVVAIKALAPHLAASAAARRRFVREAQAAAAVRDEHVVAIHAVDEANGVPYLVMEYISGISLQERLDRQGPLQLKEVLRIGMQTAAGLSAAHAQGLVHRDVKPANILLENGVERVKLTDFGLARAADDAQVTQSGVVAGTPQYMAPEQAQGQPLDPRADLFSLGSVLYALCTGRPPFRADGPLAVLKRVCEDTPRPIREINPEVPEWLAAVIARLQAKDRDERYASATEVAELLGKYLARVQDSALAPPSPTVTSAVPAPAGRPRRRRWRLAAAGLLLLFGGLGLAEATGTTRVVATAVRVFTPDGTLVVETDDPGVKVTIEGDGDLVITGAGPHEVRLRPGQYRWQATKDGRPVGGDLVTISRGGRQLVRVSRAGTAPAAAAPPASPLDRLDPAAVPAAERFAWQPKELVAVLGEHRARNWNWIQTVACSPDGKLVASADRSPLVVLWDAGTLRPRALLQGHTGWVYGLAFAPDSRRLLSCSGDGTIRLWDATTGKERLRFVGPGVALACVRFAPDGHRALSGGDDGLVRVWDADTGRERSRLAGHKGPVGAVAFSPDGRRALSGGADHTARVWDLEAGKELGCFTGHPGMVRGVAFLPDGKRALSAHAHQARDGQDLPAPEYGLRLWDVDTGKELQRYDGHTDGVLSLDLSADGRHAVSAGQDATVRLWDVAAGRELHGYAGHFGLIWGVALTPDGRWAFSGGTDGVVRQWDLDRHEEVPPPAGNRGAVGSLAFSPDGRYLLSGAWSDRSLRLWDLASGREQEPFTDHDLGIWCVAFAQDGRLALSGSADRTLRLWDVASRQELHRCTGHAGWVHSLAVSPDGRRAFTCGFNYGDRTVRCWDVDSGRELGRFEPPGYTDNLALTPDGRRLLTCGFDHIVYLWDADSRQELRRWEGHTGQIVGLAVAPDGRQAASCGLDGMIWLWSLTTPEEPARRLPPWHTEKQLRCVAFSPDGKTLASSDAGGRIILWDVAAGKRLRQWQVPGLVNCVAFAPDGRHLATANGNGTIYILRLGKDGAPGPG